MIIQLEYRSGNKVSLSHNKSAKWKGELVIIYSGCYFVFSDNKTGKIANFIQIEPLNYDRS